MRSQTGLAILLGLTVPASAAPNASSVQPANLSVEVTSLRLGATSRKTVAKVRPGDQILLRDERDIPYVMVAGARGSKSSSVASGLVVTVVPVLEGGKLAFRMTSTVRTLDGFEDSDYAPDGKEVFKVKLPKVGGRTYEETIQAVASEGSWSVRQDLGASGFGVSVVAKPLAR